MAQQWYFSSDGLEKSGPVSVEDLGAALAASTNPGATLVWRGGLREWTRARDVPELAATLAPMEASMEASAASPPSADAVPALPVPGATDQAGGAGKGRYPAPVLLGRNFIARNWRGEFPLPVSYWVFGFLGNIFVGAFALAAGELLATRGYNPLAIFISIVAVWLAIAVVMVWQLVSVWRSAGHYLAVRRVAGKHIVWGYLARIAMVLGAIRIIMDLIGTGAPQLAETSRMAFQNDPDIPDYSIRTMRNGTEAEIRGGFKYGLTDDFLKVLRASPQIKVVHLNSPGGRIGEATGLNKIIHERGLITYTSSRCVSACMVAFAAGKERWILRGNRLGFHSGAFPGMDDADRANDNAQRAIFQTAGFEAGFIQRAVTTPNTTMWFPTIDELTRAHVITAVSDGKDFAASGFAGIATTRDSLAKELESPTLKALREKFPQDYDALIDIYYEGYKAERNEADMFAAGREKLVERLQAYRSFADDGVLLDLGRLYMEQLQALNSTACYTLAAGSGGVTIPDALAKRETVINERIIATADLTRQAVTRKITGPIWDRVFKQMSADAGAAMVTLIKSGTKDPMRYADYCSASISLMRWILAQKPDDAVQILREIWAKDGK